MLIVFLLKELNLLILFMLLFTYSLKRKITSSEYVVKNIDFWGYDSNKVENMSY